MMRIGRALTEALFLILFLLFLRRLGVSETGSGFFEGMYFANFGPLEGGMAGSLADGSGSVADGSGSVADGSGSLADGWVSNFTSGDYYFENHPNADVFV